MEWHFQTSKVENNLYDTLQSASIQENVYGMSFFKTSRIFSWELANNCMVCFKDGQ